MSSRSEIFFSERWNHFRRLQKTSSDDDDDDDNNDDSHHDDSDDADVTNFFPPKIFLS